MRTIDHKYSLTCHFCGDTFMSAKRDAKTCSNKCRQSMFRWRKRLPRLEVKATALIDQIEGYLYYEQARPYAVQIMKSIKENIERAYLNSGVKVVRHG